jgi:hypothetical protein
MSTEQPPDRSGKPETQKIPCPKCENGIRTFVVNGETKQSQCQTCRGTGQIPG